MKIMKSRKSYLNLFFAKYKLGRSYRHYSYFLFQIKEGDKPKVAYANAPYCGLSLAAARVPIPCGRTKSFCYA
jgi:hypothetical protein